MRQAVGLLVLAVLAGAPVSSVVCATLCEPAANHGAAASHDPEAAGVEGCHEATIPSPVRIGATSRHACGDHDGASRDVAALPATSREGMGLMPGAAYVLAPASVASGPETTGRSLSSHGPPAYSSALKRTSVVLRI